MHAHIFDTHSTASSHFKGLSHLRRKKSDSPTSFFALRGSGERSEGLSKSTPAHFILHTPPRVRPLT